MANDEKRFCIAYASGLVDQLLMEKTKWNGSKSKGTHCEQGVKVQKGQDTSKGQQGTRSTNFRDFAALVRFFVSVGA